SVKQFTSARLLTMSAAIVGASSPATIRCASREHLSMCSIRFRSGSPGVSGPSWNRVTSGGIERSRMGQDGGAVFGGHAAEQGQVDSAAEHVGQVHLEAAEFQQARRVVGIGLDEQ